MSRKSMVKWTDIKDYVLIPCPGCDPRGECNVLLEYKGTFTQWIGPLPSLWLRIKDFLFGEEHLFWCPRCEVARSFEEIQWEHRDQILECLKEADGDPNKNK